MRSGDSWTITINGKGSTSISIPGARRSWERNDKQSSNVTRLFDERRWLAGADALATLSALVVRGNYAEGDEAMV